MLSIEAISGDRYKVLNYYASKLGYSEEQIDTFVAVLDTIKTIMEEKVKPNSLEWDRVGAKLKNGKVILPPKMEEVMFEIIRDNQLYAFFIPEKHGGFGYSNVFQAALTELITEYDLSLQVLSFISLSVLEAILVYHKPNFDKYIEDFIEGKRVGYVGFTEPQAGSNLEKVKTTSVLEGDEYIINGTKIFISNGGYAETGLVLAKNMVNGKQDGTNVFLVDNLENVEVLRLEEKSGLHANPTAQLLFNDVRVPAENVIAEVGDGYKKVLERLMGMRLGVISQANGAATRAYKLARDYSEERIQFGKSINSFDGVSRKLREMEAQLPRMRAYGYLAGYALDRYYNGWIPAEIGASGPESEKTAAKTMPSPARVGLAHYYISAAKLYTTEIAQTFLYDAQQIFGGNGFISEMEINKIARDIRVLPIYEGTTEIHEWLIDRAQQVVALLPKFERLYPSFGESTVYERILFERFPDVKDKI